MVSSGKRGMVWAGGSSSRIIGDQGTNDPGGGERVSGRGQPVWQLPVGHEHGTSWASSMQAFPPFGSHPAEIHGQDNRKVSVLARVGVGVHRRWSPQCPELGNLGGGCGLLEGMVGLQGN